MKKGPHALLTGEINIFVNDTSEFVILKRIHILVVKGLNFFTSDILECIVVGGGGSRPGCRMVKYFYERYFRIY